MIKTLQRKFIMITMGSLIAVMVVLVGSINIVNIIQINHRADGMIKIISDNQGKFPKFDKSEPPKKVPEYGFKLNEESQFETRFFVVKLNSDNSIRNIDTSNSSISSNDASEYAQLIVSNDKKGGWHSFYKYSVVEQSNGNMIVFLDCRSQMQTATLVLFTSLGVAIFTLFGLFIIVSIFSKKAIRPIVESMDKQKLFITNAGHEIKTPLAIISANADVLELTNGQNEWIKSIRNQTTRLDKLIKNLLTLSKMDEQNRDLAFSEVDFSRLVVDVSNSFKTLCDSSNKEFVVDIANELFISGNADSLEQLVSTLIDNSIKYSSENGLIKVKLTPYKKGAKLEVYNTTEYIEDYSKEGLNKLFDRFYRADTSRSRDTGSYGIGLSVAKSIVQAHKGKITVKSEDGNSICFTVIL